ncbi:MAG: NADP-dependent oxidoreductase [Pseudomonadota bacterium]|nr:NADP-dependent oxidoreductase [Pseudomonadota bacterium]
MNQGWQLARTPLLGWPEKDDFKWFETALPEPGPGQALTETLYLSMDPYQWGRRRSGVETPGDVCHGRTVSRVLISHHQTFTHGDYVFNTNGWQSHGLIGDGIDIFGYMAPRQLDPAKAPISTAIGVLGMLGLTAWSGMKVQCAPQPGETVVVSAASGGVGQIAGQIARMLGCRVIGIAGAKHKCQFVSTELGFDECVSHLSEDLPGDLRTACPDGIDVYFENVGGLVFEAVAPLLNKNARISLCGMISQYSNTDGGDTRAAWNDIGAPWLSRQDVKVNGLFVGDFVDNEQEIFLDTMSGWIRDGHVRYKEDLWDGLPKAPSAFMAMLKGGNFGKTLVAVGKDPTADADIIASRSGTNVLSAHQANPSRGSRK